MSQQLSMSDDIAESLRNARSDRRTAGIVELFEAAEQAAKLIKCTCYHECRGKCFLYEFERLIESARQTVDLLRFEAAGGKSMTGPELFTGSWAE